MKSLFTASLLAAALFTPPAMAQEPPSTLNGVRLVNAEQARDLAAKGAPLIDARSANEFAEKTIKGAVLVSYRERSEKTANFDRSKDSFDLAKLPADKKQPLVLFCNGGTCWKSYKAAVLARDAGYSQIAWFRGGLIEWSAKGLPTQ